MIKDQMRLVLHRGIPEDETFREQWNRLVDVMEHPQVFYTCEWALAVSRTYSSSLELLLLAAYRDETLTGIAALAFTSNHDRISFLTSATADYCDFISAPADREEFACLVMEELRAMGVAELRLANLPADSASARVLRAAARTAGYSVFLRPAYVCAQVSLNSREERLQAHRSATRKLKRTANAVTKPGAITVEHRGNWEGFVSEFPQFTTAHVSRFLAADRLSNLVHPERRAFLIELARLLSARGWFTLSTLTLRDRTIAWNYGFKYAGSWFWYQPAFDTEFEELSPGSHLLCEIIRQGSEDPGIRTVDLGLGDESYKQRYARTGRQTLYITASRSKARATLETCRYRATEFVRARPRFEKLVRRHVSRIVSLRANVRRRGITGYLSHCISRALRSTFDAAEILFFEWIPGNCLISAQSEVLLHPSVSIGTSPKDATKLQPLSIKLLAAAAMRYAGDEDTLKYLLRSAKRLRSGGAQGFVLVASTGSPAHFCWVTRFEGFKMAELNQVLKEPAAGSVLLFDCWTPTSERGRGHYGLCTCLVASRMLEAEKRPWIFSAATNVSSLRGLEHAGFVRRFSLVRKKGLLLNRISGVEFKSQGEPMLDLYPAA